MTVNKPRPCSLDACAELTQGPPQIPPTPGPGAVSYLLNPLQGADPTLPETSSSHIPTKCLSGPLRIKSVSSAKPALDRKYASHSNSLHQPLPSYTY